MSKYYGSEKIAKFCRILYNIRDFNEKRRIM